VDPLVVALELTGIAGWAARVIESVGAWGVGLLALLETVFPPIPSEVILPLAGYLSQQGQLSFVMVILASTAGAYGGALVLYLLGAKLGLERSIRGLARLPLVDREDFERAAGWFDRHGRSSVFFGRLIPGVRSLISLPAGAHRMSLGTFSLFTIAGSGLWNTLLVSLGAALGTRHEVIAQYSHYLDYAVYAALAVVLAMLVARRVQRTRAAASVSAHDAGDPRR
jgi:membrane protein DedA with SNARE-associated domain